MISKDIRFPVIAEEIWPANGILLDIALVCLGSILVGLSAQIEIPLYPVPVTGQTFGALLVGMIMGKKRGALSLLFYVFQGGIGFPFFAGGSFGFAKLAGPTGGYLVGMVGAAFVTGFLAERGWDRRVDTTACAMLLGNLVIYVFGLPWLACFVGWGTVLMSGFYPFVLGDFLKLTLAALLFPSARSLLKTK